MVAVERLAVGPSRFGRQLGLRVDYCGSGDAVLNRFLLLLVLVLALMPVQAATDVREYRTLALHFNDADGVVPATSFAYPAAPFSYPITARQTIVEWTAGITTSGPSLVGTDAYTIALTIKEGATTKTTCSVMFSRDNTLAGRLEYFIRASCGGQPLVAGTTYTYEVAVTMGSGANRITESSYSLLFVQTDSITVPDPATTTELATHATNTTQFLQHLNSHAHDFQGNMTQFLQHLNGHLHESSVNHAITHAEVLAAIQNLNVTIIGNVTGNFTLDNVTLSAIYSILIEKLGPPGEPVNINLSPTTQAIVIFALLALLAYFMGRGALPFKLAAAVGAMAAFLMSASLGFNGLALLGMALSGALLTLAVIMASFEFKAMRANGKHPRRFFD